MLSTPVYTGFTASGADPEGDTLSFVCTITPNDGSFWCDSSSKSVAGFEIY